MKQFLQELLYKEFYQNAQKIVSSAIKDTHCMGLNSIVLIDVDGFRLRMYHATKKHQLWRNNSTSWDIQNPNTFSVGFHPHHSDLYITTIFGDVYNWTIEEYTTKEPFVPTLNKYRYTSSITNDEGKFSLVSKNVSVRTYAFERLAKGYVEFLPAKVLHTIYVHEGKEAAWLVLERTKDQTYDPIIYSNDDLTKFDFDAHYNKCSNEEVAAMLSFVGLRT